MKYIDRFLKILEQTDYNALVRKEWFLFCTINIFLPMMMGSLLLMIPIYDIRSPIALFFAILILVANIYRIKNTKQFKKFYYVISVLNILSLFIASDIVFITSMFEWPDNLMALYQVTLGGGYPN